MAACSHSRRRRARLFDLFYQVEIRSRHLLQRQPHTGSSAAMPKEYDATMAILGCDVILPSSQLDFGDVR
jgi:hypothetical protein